MQLTASEATCPLCKHPVTASAIHPDPTRLCEDCQRIVQTIRPTANAHLGVIDPPQARATSQPKAAVGVQTEVPNSSASVLEETSLSFPQFVESSQTELREPARDVEAEDPEPALLDFDELFEYEPFGNADAHEAPALPREPLQDQDFSRESILVTESMVPPAVQPAPAPCAVFEPHVETLAVAEAMQHLSAEIYEPQYDSGNVSIIDGEPAADLLHDEVTTSPLNEPARDLQHSPFEYPLLFGKQKSGRGSRLRLSLVAGLVVCCVVAAYFLVYRPSIQVSQSGTALGPRSANLALPTTAIQPGPSQASTQAVAAKESAAPEPVEQMTPQSVRTSEGSGARYSLQAAAFPNDAGATEFCERLKRAGVPAYTTSAEIAGRGKWFRVRIGKFETAQAAERFASEARLRARASGLNLQLIVSTYETP